MIQYALQAVEMCIAAIVVIMLACGWAIVISMWWTENQGYVKE